MTCTECLKYASCMRAWKSATTMTCADCALYANCTLSRKGTPDEACYINANERCYVPGTDSWCTCSGCGTMRPKAQAEKFPCEMCAKKDLMAPEMWTKVKEKNATHQALVMENLT